MQGFSDADYANSKDDRTGYCVFLGDSLVSWSSNKQSVVSCLSAELEYRALALIACKLTWLESLIHEMAFLCPPIPITWCDNMSASALAMNLVFHARTKHIKVDLHFVRDKVLEYKLEVRYVPSHN